MKVSLMYMMNMGNVNHMRSCIVYSVIQMLI